MPKKTPSDREEGGTRHDVELMLETGQGNTRAFEELVRRYQGPLIRFFHRLLWRKDLAEDYAQEVFCRLYIHRESYKPTAKFSTYLFRIATNYWIDQVRHRASHGTPVSLSAGPEEETSLERVLPSQEPLPEERMVRREEVGRLRRALDRLPLQTQMLLSLAEGEGLKYQEIAEILEIPVGTVKSRMHAAVGKLRQMMT